MRLSPVVLVLTDYQTSFMHNAHPVSLRHELESTMKSVRIYHNPRCSKSRQTLELIESGGVKPDIVEYLKQAPNFDELDNILNMLGIEPRELMRRHEKAYQENNLEDATLSRENLINAMIANPILIERPIVIKGKHAIIGRPPEKVLELL
jgi:arsenate reductase (glutaredoxin)